MELEHDSPSQGSMLQAGWGVQQETLLCLSACCTLQGQGREGVPAALLPLMSIEMKIANTSQ